MCLSNVRSEELTQKWLDEKSNIVVGYKLVRKKASGYYPICSQTSIPFTVRKINKLKKQEAPFYFDYVPYYHIFMTIEGAKSWQNPPPTDEVIIKCEIPKKHITALGTQNIGGSYKHVIITKVFKIVGEVE